MNSSFSLIRPAILSVSFILSTVLGVVGTSIPWGTDDGLHGQGVPIPLVLWDRVSYYQTLKPGEQDYFIDFPNPLAYIENPLVLFVALLFVWAIIEGILWLFGIRKRRKKAEQIAAADRQ